VRLQKRRALGSGVLGLGAALVLAGCGAGQITQTDTQQAAVNGANASSASGAVAVRDASVVNRNGCQQAYTAGSDASLKLTIANSGGTPDELVSVTSTGAASASVQGQQTIFARSSIEVGPVDEPESAPGSASASPTATPSQSPTTGAATDHATVVLQGLKAPLWPGQLLPVTFVFRDAGPLTVEMPIAAPTQTLTCESTAQATP
jgi:copper(I)-binding protein